MKLYGVIPLTLVVLFIFLIGAYGPDDLTRTVGYYVVIAMAGVAGIMTIAMAMVTHRLVTHQYKMLEGASRVPFWYQAWGISAYSSILYIAHDMSWNYIGTIFTAMFICEVIFSYNYNKFFDHTFGINKSEE